MTHYEYKTFIKIPHNPVIVLTDYTKLENKQTNEYHKTKLENKQLLSVPIKTVLTLTTHTHTVDES